LKFIYYAITFLSFGAALAYIDFVYFVPEITAQGFDYFSFHGLTMVGTSIALPCLMIPAISILGDFYFGKQKQAPNGPRAQ
jgi:hypothetical protein